MAEQLLDAVERLQSRLSETVEPKKILKTLRRLGELPMTVEILVDTGVGKTVNSFRKHELAGEVAKDLVAKWKKLVPQPSADRPSISHSKEPLRSHGPPRAHHDAGAGGHRRPRLPSPQPRGGGEEEEEQEEQEEPSYLEMEEEEEEEEEMMTTMEEEHEEDRGYSRGYSPSPPSRHHHHQQQQPQQLQHERYSPQPRGGGYRSEEYDDSPPHSPPPVSPSPPPPPPARSKDAGRHGKQHKEPGKNPNQQPQARGSHGDRRDRERGAVERQQKKRDAPEAEPAPGGGPKAAKHGRHGAAHEGKREKERGEREDKKKGVDARPKEPAAAAEEDEFEIPTMSFESFLMYDAPTPTKKKKKPSSSSSSSSHSRPSHPSSSSSSSHARTQPAAAASSSSSSSSKPSKSNGTKSSKRSEVVSAPVAVTAEKRRRVVEVVPALPDFPLPAIQPNYRPLPSLDPMPLSPQRRKVPQPNGEDDLGFTGKRFNSKMMVYSGTKTANLPKMMTLYEQCIRVLQNNIDSIDEVGGVPFEILEPVLERCTPEQLYRIEECNRCFMEESDDLWSRHCQRDFKRASPQEYESWREMYLRLHYEREERLRMLTQNISSAHANKPKGRQVKMAFVNSVAKPPRDVRRRQEKFGTISTSTASSAAAAAPIKIRPATSYSNPSDAGQFSSSSSSFPQGSPPQGSFRSSLGAGAAAGGGAAGRDKPQVKKIAPMMAKTIKAFKNRFSRR